MTKLIMSAFIILVSVNPLLAADVASLSCKNPTPPEGGEGMGIENILIQKTGDSYSVTFTGNRFGERNGLLINGLECSFTDSKELKDKHGVRSTALFTTCEGNDVRHGPFVIRHTMIPNILWQPEWTNLPKATGERHELVIKNNPVANGRKTIYRFIPGCEQKLI